MIKWLSYLLVIGVSIGIHEAHSSCRDGTGQGPGEASCGIDSGYPTTNNGTSNSTNSDNSSSSQAEQLINIINILDTVNSSNEEARIREQEEAQRELDRQQEINDRNEARQKKLDAQNVKNSEVMATKINAEKESVNNDDWRVRANQQAASGPKGKTYIKSVNEYIKIAPDGPADRSGTQHYRIMNTSNKEILVRWCEQKNCTSSNEAATIPSGGAAKAVSFTDIDGTEIKYWACLTKYNGQMVLSDKNGACWYIKK